MKLKAIINREDPRQDSYIRFLERTFPEILTEENPDMYYVIGGDGAMLHAHKHCDADIPFFGKGLGTANFIMNEFRNDFTLIEGLLNDTLKYDIIKTPKIHVKVKGEGVEFSANAINDIIIGKDIMDWNKFDISSENGSFSNDIVQGLGLCITTTLGSTAFNFNNGGDELPIISKIWGFTGVVTDKKINEIIEPQKIKIKILSKRCKPNLYVDGVANKIELGEGFEIKIKPSKKMFKLAFLSYYEFNSKRMKLLKEKR